MKNSTHIRNKLLSLARLSLILLWLPVAVEKLWNPMGFRSTLLRQPFPDWWADILFWLLPVLELLTAILIAWPNRLQRVRQGLWLSAILLLGFTLFILFGVLGWYEKRPCGCGSVISDLSWNHHLWFNFVFLLFSCLGIRLARAGNPPHRPYRRSITLFIRWLVFRCKRFYRTAARRIRFPRKFALFRRRAL